MKFQIKIQAIIHGIITCFFVVFILYPLGGFAETKVNCPIDKPFFDEADQSCVKRCAEDELLMPNKFTPYKHVATCVQSCKPDQHVLPSDISKYNESRCVKACPRDKPLLAVKDQCVDHCPEATSLDHKHQCVYCLDELEAFVPKHLSGYYDDTCADRCPEGTARLPADDTEYKTDVCLKPSNCPSDKPFYDKPDQQCVARCPEGKPFIKGTKKCVKPSNCPIEKPLYNVADNQCVFHCPEHTDKTESEGDKICVAKCQDQKWYDVPSDACVSTCPDARVKVADKHKCVKPDNDSGA